MPWNVTVIDHLVVSPLGLHCSSLLGTAGGLIPPPKSFINFSHFQFICERRRRWAVFLVLPALGSVLSIAEKSDCEVPEVKSVFFFPVNFFFLAE